MNNLILGQASHAFLFPSPFTPFLFRITYFVSQHYDTPDNNDRTPFDFTEENAKLAKKIISKYTKYLKNYLNNINKY